MAREKTVFRDTFHVWAQQTRAEGRNSTRNRRFAGEFAYSYAEPIARIITIKGNRIALHRDYTFSSTTSGMQSECRGATRHYTSVSCRHIGDYSRWENGYNELTQTAKNKWGINHKANLAKFRADIAEAWDKFTRAKGRAGWALSHADSLIASANEYAEVFGLVSRFARPAMSEAEIAGRLNYAKEWQAQSEARAEVRNKARAAQWEAQRIARAEAEAKARAESLDNFGKWFTGEVQTLAFRYLPDELRATDYLRVQGDNVQTSQGAIVPIEHVRRALPIVLTLFASGRTYKRNGHTIHLGEYALDSISEDGTIRAGCHTFARAEVIRFAGTIGLAQTVYSGPQGFTLSNNVRGQS